MQNVDSRNWGTTLTCMPTYSINQLIYVRKSNMTNKFNEITIDLNFLKKKKRDLIMNKS